MRLNFMAFVMSDLTFVHEGSSIVAAILKSAYSCIGDIWTDLANLHAVYDFSVLDATLFRMVHAFSCADMFCDIIGRSMQLVFASLRLIFANSLAPMM